MKMRRVCFVLAAVLMLGSVGCGSSASPATPSPTASTKSTESTESAASTASSGGPLDLSADVKLYENSYIGVAFGEGDGKEYTGPNTTVLEGNAGDITSLELSYAVIDSFDFLKGCTGMEKLAINECMLAEGLVLPELPKLEVFYSRDSEFFTFDTLANNHKVHTLSVSAFMNGLDDISPLKDFTKLESLSLLNCTITSLEPLRGLTDLREVTLTGEDVVIDSLEPLMDKTGLEKLSISYASFDTVPDEEKAAFSSDVLEWIRQQ